MICLKVEQNRSINALKQSEAWQSNGHLYKIYFFSGGSNASQNEGNLKAAFFCRAKEHDKTRASLCPKITQLFNWSFHQTPYLLHGLLHIGWMMARTNLVKGFCTTWNLPLSKTALLLTKRVQNFFCSRFILFVMVNRMKKITIFCKLCYVTQQQQFYFD